MKHVLVVDDDTSICDMLETVLTGKGFRVSKAADGLEAMAIVKGGDVDLVVTDLLMPRQEGIETIMELRKMASCPKIIAMSGGMDGDPDHILRMASCLGADCVFRKPFLMKDLAAKVITLLEDVPSPPPVSP